MLDSQKREMRDTLPRTQIEQLATEVTVSAPGQEETKAVLLDLGRGGLGIALKDDSNFDLTTVSQVKISVAGGLLSQAKAEVAFIRDGVNLSMARNRNKYMSPDFSSSSPQASAISSSRDGLVADNTYSYDGDVVPRTSDKYRRIGLKLLTEDEKPLSQLTFSRTDEGWDLITDKKDITDLFSDLLAYGTDSKMTIHLSKQMLTGRLQDHGQLKTQKEIKLDLTTKEKIQPGTPLVITFERYGCTYLFHSESRYQLEGELALSIPGAAIRLLRRKTNRLSDEKIHDFHLRIEHPLTARRSGLLNICQINEQGCLVRLPKDFPLYPIFLEQVPLCLEWCNGGNCDNGQEAIYLFGSIRSVHDSEDKDHYYVGLSLNFPEEDGRRKFTAELIQRRRQLIDIVYHDSDHQKIWQLMDESKYLDEKSRESFKPMVEITKDVWPKLQKGMDQISRKILIRQDEQIMGHMQLDRAYPNAWLVHQLAIHPSMSKIIAGDMYGAVTDFLSGKGIKYIISATREDKAWNKRNYYDFVANYPYPEHNHVERVFMYEVDMANFSDVNSDLNPGNCTEYDLKLIERYADVNFHPLKKKALAFNKNELSLSSLSNEYEKFNLYRKRSIIVYKEARQLIAFALIEESSNGISIFNLFDSFETYFVADVSADEQKKIERELIRAALSYYREKGKIGVIFCGKIDDKQFYEGLGLKFVFNEIRWFADCEASKRYNAFSQTMYGRLLARRNSRKRK